MSEPIRIALVAEGITDAVVLKAALKSILAPRTFTLRLLQPEESLAFGAAGPLGGGWGGVYKWCLQAAKRGGGQLSSDGLLFDSCDALIVHVDADVADKTYRSANVEQAPGALDLPCAAACPPVQATISALQPVVLSWCGESAVPPKTIVCIPSKSTEAWVVSALFPNDAANNAGLECMPDPVNRLTQRPKLDGRIKKSEADYRKNDAALEEAWPRLTGQFDQASSFQADVLVVLP